MYKVTLISFLLSVFLLPCFNQQISDNQNEIGDEHAEYTAGITSFSPILPMALLDSVVHFEFKEGQLDPNVGRRIFHFDENYILNSIEESYRDRIYDYVSGYIINYTYDGTGRVSDVTKSSWNSSIENLSIEIGETYAYEDDYFRRFSTIEWRTVADTSSLDFHEDYYYDGLHQLVDYTMFVPPEINPEQTIYSESYNYDSIGFLTYESQDLSENGSSLSLKETQYQNFYDQDSLPQLIYSTIRTEETGGWNDLGVLRYFYDDLNRNTMRAETKAQETGKLYEKQIYSFDDENNIIKKVRYVSSDSVNYQLADSILYYHSKVGSEEVEEEVEEEVVEEEEEKEDPGEEEVTTPDPFEFSLFPNPTDGILHVRSGIDSPSEIRVIDASGRVIIVRHLENGIVDIDLTPYPDGYYIVMLVSNVGYQTGRVFKF